MSLYRQVHIFQLNSKPGGKKALLQVATAQRALLYEEAGDVNLPQAACPTTIQSMGIPGSEIGGTCHGKYGLQLWLFYEL